VPARNAGNATGAQPHFSALLARHADASGDVAQVVVWGGLEESFGADWWAA
jgi:hypothetical protein